MKTRLDVLKQHAETTKVLKFQGWMRELITMLEAAEKAIDGRDELINSLRESGSLGHWNDDLVNEYYDSQQEQEL